MVITLKDGKTLNFDSPVSGEEVAESIGSALAKAALVMSLDGRVVDLKTKIETESIVEIITRDDPRGLDILRHDAAHVLAEAVVALFPETQVTLGPVIEDGFYYDFYRKEAFSDSDLADIEKKMVEIVERDEEIIREVWQRQRALDYYHKRGEKFKVELIEGFGTEEEISFYRQGEFIDLCRGPHLPSTGKLGKAFKLMKVAGAYWRGDSSRENLQRIYGTAWANQKQLKQYLHRLQEAQKRDHRKLGKELDLFHIEEHSPGMIFWHPKGTCLYETMVAYMRDKMRLKGYQEVRTPEIVERTLWEKSGHWEKFSDMMFTTHSEHHEFAVKPMNCPCHIAIFNQGLKSWRDLPLRFSEFGKCHRNELTGTMHGLMRVRAMVQDDGHIFCTEEQIASEVKAFCELVKETYEDFGFEEVLVKFATRPQKRVGSEKNWDRAEKALEKSANEAGLKTILNPGEGAFYGPKLEFVLKDSLSREWQCGTIQVDFNLPERLGACYVNANGQKEQPVMLHRAVLGSFERFIGILIEEYAGTFPLWLAPVQIVLATISVAHEAYARTLKKHFTAKGLRCEIDVRNEKIGYKIREHTYKRIPILAAIGDKEVKQGTLELRRIGSRQTKTLSLEQTLQAMQREIENKGKKA